MSKEKINIARMMRLVNEGVPQVNIAAEFGVSSAAISKRIQEIRGRTTHAIVAAKIDQVIDGKIDFFAQLEKINKRANDLLDKAETDTQDTIKLMSEIRAQLKLQLELFETMYSLRAAAEFQDVVLDVIGKIDLNVRKQIIQELNSRSAIRSAVTFR